MSEIQPKFLEYLDWAVRTHGFCVVDADVAFKLTDLWASRQHCGLDFTLEPTALQTIAHRRGAIIHVAAAQGVDRPVYVVAIDDDEIELERRVEWSTGLRIT